jgi:hypothetical protein
VRRIIAVIVMATGILVALPSYPVDASRVPDLQCGVTPTSSVRLRTDLTCTEAFTLPADNPPLTIDLGGHTLTFTDTSCAPGHLPVQHHRPGRLGDHPQRHRQRLDQPR